MMMPAPYKNIIARFLLFKNGEFHDNIKKRIIFGLTEERDYEISRRQFFTFEKCVLSDFFAFLFDRDEEQ